MESAEAAARPTWSEGLARGIVEGQRTRTGALLLALQALQSTFGYVDPRAVPVVASVLNVSRAEVHGVLTFYRDLRTTPPGAVTVRVCRGEACQAGGAEALVAHARTSLGVDLGATTADGAVTLDQVFCLGNCALPPSVAVEGRTYGRIDAGRLDTLVTSAVAATR